MPGRGAFLAGAFALALAVLLPMRLALGWFSLDRLGLSVREAQGSIWGGRLLDARLGEAPLGDLHARLDALPLLIGRARIALHRTGAGTDGGVDDRLDGALLATRHGFGIEDMTAHLAAGQRFAPLPVSAIDLTRASLRFADGACVRASGLVKASMAGGMNGVDLPGGLSGTARCEGDKLLVPLASQSGMERLALRLDAQGGWRGVLSVRPANAAARDALQSAGLAPGADGAYALAIEGGR